MTDTDMTTTTRLVRTDEPYQIGRNFIRVGDSVYVRYPGQPRRRVIVKAFYADPHTLEAREVEYWDGAHMRQTWIDRLGRMQQTTNGERRDAGVRRLG